MTIDCSFLFVLDLVVVVKLCVGFHPFFLLAVGKVGLSIAYIFLFVVDFLGLQFSFQNFL